MKKLREKGEVIAVGQLLGHKVPFENLQHAKTTMMKMRQHNLQKV